MDPYAAQWAHYGYAISTPADAGNAAAYPAYYNYPGVQVTNSPAVTGNNVPVVPGVVKTPRQTRPQGAGATPVTTTSWQQSATLLPGTTYVPTKTFVKAGGQSGETSVYDPSNSAMKLHQLALHNSLNEIYEKAECAIPGMQAVRVKIGNEVFVGMGTNFKAAKQDAATKAITESKLPKPPERKTLKPRPLGITATQELHELATKKGLTVKFKFIEPYNFEFKASMRLWSKDEMRGSYRVQLTVGTMEFLGHAEFPQQAKHNASMQALPYLNQMPDIKAPAKAVVIPKNSAKQATETASMTKEGKNVIMVLNEIAMQQQVCIDWNIVDEEGAPHMKVFTYTLKMGSYEAVGSGNSKKLAKAIAAQNMYQTIPEEWKNVNECKTPKRKQPNKRKKPMPTPPPTTVVPSAAPIIGPTNEVITSTNTTLDSLDIPGEKKLKASGEGPNTPKAAVTSGVTPVYSVIQTANPISALYEYCKKVKYPDPVFECVSENVLETWQKNNHTFKKTEYTIKLEVAGKTYFGSANTKKAAKTAVATEAWNIIRASNM